MSTNVRIWVDEEDMGTFSPYAASLFLMHQVRTYPEEKIRVEPTAGDAHVIALDLPPPEKRETLQ